MILIEKKVSRKKIQDSFVTPSTHIFQFFLCFKWGKLDQMCLLWWLNMPFIFNNFHFTHIWDDGTWVMANEFILNFQKKIFWREMIFLKNKIMYEKKCFTSFFFVVFCEFLFDLKVEKKMQFWYIFKSFTIEVVYLLVTVNPIRLLFMMKEVSFNWLLLLLFLWAKERRKKKFIKIM